MHELIHQTINEIGPGKMSDVAYDTAWIARLGEIDWDLSSHALAWLTEHQLSDGSWGAEKPFYYHDRIISTLAAMIALTYRGRRQSDKRLIEKGLEALGRITSGATNGLSSAFKGPTVGFEMIVPTLVAEAESLGIIKQQKDRILGRIAHQRAQKLSHIKGKMIDRHLTVAFSAEMAGMDGQQVLDIKNLQEKNGSVGCSPSATAYFVLQVQREEKRGLEYLRKIRGESGGAPNVAPFDTFEIAWTLWNLSLIPGYTVSLKDKVQRHVDFLAQTWDTGCGAGFSSEYSVNDSDGTSVVFDTLLRYGITRKADNILGYEEEDYFRCFALESDPSISSNIHVLGALRQAGYEKDNPSIQKIIRFLQKRKINESYWDDKWHLSPYYATSHAIIACTGYEDTLVSSGVQWLIQTQKPDGSWGVYDSTAEETAYALQALWLWEQNSGHVPRECLQNGKRWLEDNEPKHEPLWIGKCLYSPRLVIDSAILSALTMVK